MDNLKKHITDRFKAIDTKDYTTVESMLDPQHKFNDPLTPEPADRKGHVELLRNMEKGLTGTHNIDVVVSDGHEWVSTRGHWTGKHTGEFNGVAATNRNITFTWINIQHVVKGKIVDEYMEMNPTSVMQQIGAAPVNA